MGYTAARFQSEILCDNEDGAIELLAETRAELDPLSKAISKKTTPSRLRNKIADLANEYASTLTGLVNAMNRSQTREKLLLEFHSELLDWLRFLAPGIKLSSETEVEKHACSLCRRCFAASFFQLGCRVAQKALSSLESLRKQKENHPKRAASNEDFSKDDKMTVPSLLCVLLASQCELRLSGDARDTARNLSDELSTCSRSNSEGVVKYASSARRALLRMASAQSSENAALEAYKTRSEALNLMVMESCGGTFDLIGFADLAQKAALSYERANIAQIDYSELILGQLEAVNVFEKQLESLRSCEQLAAEEISAWVDWMVQVMLKYGRVKEAKKLARAHIRRLESAHREDLGSILETQILLSVVDENDWTSIIEIIEELPVRPDSPSFALRICRSLEVYRRQICSKANSTTIEQRHAFLTHYLNRIIPPLSSAMDESTRYKLVKSSAAVMEAAKHLCETRVHLFIKSESSDHSHYTIDVEECFEYIGQAVEFGTSTEVPKEWRKWTASILYNNAVILYNAKVDYGLPSRILFKAIEWSDDDDLRARSLLLQIKISTSVSREIFEDVLVMAMEDRSLTEVSMSAVLTAIVKSMTSAGKESTERVLRRVSNGSLVSLLKIQRARWNDLSLHGIRTAVCDEAERREGCGEADFDQLVISEEKIRAALLEGDAAEVRALSYQLITSIKEESQGRELEDSTKLALAQAYAYRGIMDGDSRSTNLAVQILHGVSTDDREKDLQQGVDQLAKVLMFIAKLSQNMVFLGLAASVVHARLAKSSALIELAEVARILGLEARSGQLLNRVEQKSKSYIVDLEKAFVCVTRKDFNEAVALVEDLPRARDPLFNARYKYLRAILDLEKEAYPAAESALIESLKLLLAISKTINAPEHSRGPKLNIVTVCGIDIPAPKGLDTSVWNFAYVLLEILRTLSCAEEHLHNVHDAIYYLKAAASVANAYGATAVAAQVFADAAVIAARSGSMDDSAACIESAKACLSSGNSSRLEQINSAYVALREADVFLLRNELDSASNLVSSARKVVFSRGVDILLEDEWKFEPEKTPREAALVGKDRIHHGQQRRSSELIPPDDYPQDLLARRLEHEAILLEARCDIFEGRAEKALKDVGKQVENGDGSSCAILVHAFRSSHGTALEKQIDATWRARTRGPRNKTLETYRQLLHDAEGKSRLGSLDQRQMRLLLAETNDNPIHNLLGSVGVTAGLRYLSKNGSSDTSSLENELGLLSLGDGQLLQRIQEALPEKWNVAGLALTSDRTHLLAYQIRKRSTKIERIALRSRSYEALNEEFQKILGDAKGTSITAATSVDLKSEDKKNWWQSRHDLDKRLEDLCKRLEKSWLQSCVDMVLNQTGPTILLADDSLQPFPWEMMPSVQRRQQQISRIPCAEVLIGGLEARSWERPVNGNQSYFVLNPGGDLTRTQERFEGMFRHEFGWNGASGKQEAQHLASAGLRSSIEKCEVFVYCGHGAAESVLPTREVKKLKRAPVSLLFGCSSGRLEKNGMYDCSGTVLEYLVSGSSCVVATLWDVTDRDIDRFTEAMLRDWMTGKTVAQTVQNARSACKLKHIVGAAPIVYGIPSMQITHPDGVHRRLF
ncbi:hypothetical protein NDN08_005894 [Rhodosorus marinus]|uniref:separase n=1 Tax=Rhodosorus marinus TaxID=101924 RepID=A0AAV8V520_9RHOD|nr:hypothetical protein NDN08_005894 [Rhodosorus marinus]